MSGSHYYYVSADGMIHTADSAIEAKSLVQAGGFLASLHSQAYNPCWIDCLCHFILIMRLTVFL